VNEKYLDRRAVIRKGCLKISAGKVCVNLGEAVVGSRRMFYCMEDFPEDCSKYGCPKMMPIDKIWLRDLRKTELYK
jgi:hypothetical protein